jgi:hypothetical protein
MCQGAEASSRIAIKEDEALGTSMGRGLGFYGGIREVSQMSGRVIVVLALWQLSSTSQRSLVEAQASSSRCEWHSNYVVSSTMPLSD